MTYIVDKKKQKKFYKKAMKITQKKAGGFISFSYYLAIFMRILAVAVGGYSAYKMYLTNPYWFEYLIPLSYFGAFFGLSFLPAAVLKGWTMGTLVKKYNMSLSASDEKFTIDGDTYTYSYFGDTLLQDGANQSHFVFTKDGIKNVRYDGLGVITVEGDITEERYNGDTLISTFPWGELNLINKYQGINLRDIFSN